MECPFSLIWGRILTIDHRSTWRPKFPLLDFSAKSERWYMLLWRYGFQSIRVLRSSSFCTRKVPGTGWSEWILPGRCLIGTDCQIDDMTASWCRNCSAASHLSFSHPLWFAYSLFSRRHLFFKFEISFLRLEYIGALLHLLMEYT